MTEPARAVARLASRVGGRHTRAAATAPRQTLLSIFGTVVFNLYSFAVRVFGGPPLLPWGSTVTVKSSTLDDRLRRGVRGARGLVRARGADADER